jgi:GTPase SAR1 family protein
MKVDKIGLCGTFSSGKTTIVNSLCNLDFFMDYSIFVEKSKMLKETGIPLNKKSSLLGQNVFLAERAKELLNNKFISDRTVIDVIAFTNKSDKISCFDKIDFELSAKNLIKQYDYIIYISHQNIPLEDNNVRHTDPIYREEINNEILRLLKKYNHLTKIRYIYDINLQDRINSILNILNIIH